MMNATANSFVVASLLPINATFPGSIGGGATLVVDSSYPFGESATITVEVPTGHSTTMLIRIPGWANAATTVDGKAAQNGTLVPVACDEGRTVIDVVLGASIRVERGWGVSGELAGSPIRFNGSSGPIAIPTANESDWDLQGGAGFVGSRAGQGTDIRSGNPGSTTWFVSRHPLYGMAHNVTSVHAEFEYVAGYTPPPGTHKDGAVVSVHLLDMASGTDLSGPLFTWSGLTNYSFDDFKGYSPPQTTTVSGLSVPNTHPLLMALKIDNHDRNLQVPLGSLKLEIRWTATATPGKKPPPISPYLTPPADAAVVRRGPLLFALHPRETRKIVKSYDQMLPARPLAVDYEIATSDHWAYALELPPKRTGDKSTSIDVEFEFDPNPSGGWSEQLPFDTEEYPFSIRARAWPLSEQTWGYWAGSRITAQPPPSPVDMNSTAGPATTIRMVPFGATNIRISVLPWVQGGGL